MTDSRGGLISPSDQQTTNSQPPTPTSHTINDPSSRRALLLQALLARQQPTGRGASGSPLGGSISSPQSPQSNQSNSIPLPDVPLAPTASRNTPTRPPQPSRGESIPLGISLGEGALSEALMTGNWDQVVQGLDAAAEEGNKHHQQDSRLNLPGGGVSSEQLDVAQKALEAWANNHKPNPTNSNPYQSHQQSPIQSHQPTPHYINSSSPPNQLSPAPFPWAALYPHTATAPTPLAAYHHVPLAPPHHLNQVPYYDNSEPPTRSQSFSGELPTITPPNDSVSTTTKKGKAPAKKGSGKKALASGATGSISAGEAAERAAEEESARVAQANMTPEEVEEDKRRRNTEASARFRAKKKQRDAELNQTTAQLRQRVSDLETETASLKTENRWLRELISEKTGRELDPRLLELLRATQASRMGED